MTRQSNVAKITVSLAVAALFFAGSIGISHHSMTLQSDGQMSGCPFVPGVSVCKMSPLEMIAASQNLFNAFPQQKDISLLLLLLLAVVAALVPFLGKLLPPPHLAPVRSFVSNRKYVPSNNPLQELFSSGILNPKLY